MTTNAERIAHHLAAQVALEELAEWTELRQRVADSRDPLIRRVLAAGVPKIEVTRMTGLARTTVDRIAAGDELADQAWERATYSDRPAPLEDGRHGGDVD